MMTGIINNEGLITAIGYQYPTQLPEFVNFHNYQEWKLVDGEWKPYISPETEKQLLRADIEKARLVMEEYLIDNRRLSLTTQQSLQQLQKFSSMKQLAEVGALGAMRDLLEATELDNIFDETRKQKYLLMLTP